MSRIGLLHVLTSPTRGDVEEVVLGLLQHLDPGEFRVALAAPPALLDSVARDLESVSVELARVHVDGWLRRRELGRLSAFIARFRPHLVATHTARATLLAAPLAKWHGTNVVETCHGGGARGLVPRRMVSRLVDRVIAVSEAARASLVADGYPADKIVVVPNGRDLSRLRSAIGREAVRRELGLARAVPLVGVVGRLEPRMGHADVLEAWPSIVAEFPTAHLLVVGEGPLRRRLEARARELGVADGVSFAGARGDVARVLDALDVLALPAHSEALALIAVEASALGRPVVATAVGGMPEVIREARTGRLVPPGDAAALSRAIRGVLRDPLGAQRLGRAGRDFVGDRFSLERQVVSTARVYRDVAGAARPVRRAA